MSKSFLLKHWAATLILAPFLPTLYQLVFRPIKGQVVGLLEVYPVTLIFSLVFSIPTFIIYYFIFALLNKRRTNPAVCKLILISWTVVGIVTTFIIVGGSMSKIFIVAYALAVIVTGVLIRLTTNTETASNINMVD